MLIVQDVFTLEASVSRPDVAGVLVTGVAGDDFVAPPPGGEVILTTPDGRTVRTTVQSVEEARGCFSEGRNVMILLGRELTAEDVPRGSELSFV